MEKRTSNIGIIGMAFGAIALLLALAHFWGGPFSPQPTIESVVAEKVSSIKNAAIDALKGKEPTKDTWTVEWDADRTTEVVTALMGGIALILGVISFTKSESRRVAGGAVLLGAGAIVFQFVAMYLMALLVVIIILVLISQIGLDIGL